MLLIIQLIIQLISQLFKSANSVSRCGLGRSVGACVRRGPRSDGVHTHSLPDEQIGSVNIAHRHHTNESQESNDEQSTQPNVPTDHRKRIFTDCDTSLLSAI